MSREAFLSARRTRDWHTDPEAQELRELVASSKNRLPRRIHNGLWHHEYSSRTHYVDLRWTLVCTGLEALIHTDRYGSTRQFRKRVPQLASGLGITISESEADDAYDLRSRLAHGISFMAQGTANGPSQPQLDLYDRLEDTLRLAVLRGMRERHFGIIFEDDDRIRKEFPI